MAENEKTVPMGGDVPGSIRRSQSVRTTHSQVTNDVASDYNEVSLAQNLTYLLSPSSRLYSFHPWLSSPFH